MNEIKELEKEIKFLRKSTEELDRRFQTSASLLYNDIERLKRSNKSKLDFIEFNDESTSKTINNWIANIKSVRGRVATLENKIVISPCGCLDCKHYPCNLAINERINCYLAPTKLITCKDCKYALLNPGCFVCWRKSEGKYGHRVRFEDKACELGELK